MRYIPILLLIAESGLSFYTYFSPRNYYGTSVFHLILGAIFVLLAFAIYKNVKNRLVQWAVIIISLLFGPGGYIGFGGLFALALAVSFMLLPKKA